ncbi:hypothetical protein [Arthrobacter psychrolactophilus]
MASRPPRPTAATSPAAGKLAKGAPAETAAAPDATSGKDVKPGKKAKEAKAPKAAKEPKAPKAAKEPKASKAAKAPVAKTSRRAQRTVRRRWPVVVAGTATLVLAVGVLGAGSVFPGSDATKVTEPVPHMLPVGESMAVCQGPHAVARRLGRGLGSRIFRELLLHEEHLERRGAQWLYRRIARCRRRTFGC